MKLVTPVLLAALVVLSMGAMGTVGTATLTTDSETAFAYSSPREITECTNITESGKYVLTQDIVEKVPSKPTCIQVNASDVVIDGQGHDIDVHHFRMAISVGADDRRPSNVTVRNVEVSGSNEAPAIAYWSVDGGTVSNVTISPTRVSVRVDNSSDVSVRESTLEGGGVEGTTSPSVYGVQVTNSSDTVVAANTLGGFGRALKVDDGSTNTTIANNRIHRGNYALDSGGVKIDGAVGTTVVNNTMNLRNQSGGVVVQSGASNTVIARNDISHTMDGVRISTVGLSNTGDGNETTVVENNAITESAVGVTVETNTGTLRIRNNELVGNDYGVYTLDGEGTEDIEVHYNAIVNNSQYGILNEQSATLNATNNYWGASSGPSSANDSDTPFEDPVTGALADGEGDAVSENPEEPGISNVHFDPWLNQSPPNASVGDFENAPTDPDGDGKFEDVNGDGEFDIVDVQALFANRNDPTIQNNPEKFDFNGNGEFDVVDVQALFTELTEET